MRVLNAVWYTTLAQVSARARFMSSTWSSTLCGCPFLDSLFLALFLSVCFSYLFFFYLNPELNLFLHVVVIGAIYHWHSANWGVWPLGRKHPSHRLWAQHLWRLPLLKDYWNLLPGAIQRHGALVLVWRGTRRRDHRQSALFTTVHSRARRTSGPKTSLSLFWRKFVVSSVTFRTHKNGETRTRTKFVSKTEIKSRHGKRKNQDSSWKTKRVNSRWSQNWDPQARIPNRFW